MRRLILFNMVTLNGFFEGPDGDIEWHRVDDEFNEFAIEQMRSTDMLLFGRKTYELMESYWPTQKAIKNDPIVAGMMNSYPKIVFSGTLDKADWSHTRLIKKNVPEEIKSLKQKPGKDLIIFGSADLSATLIQHSLIDEFRLMVNPVILDKGNPLFKNTADKRTLQLIKTKVFGNGNVLLCYIPEGK